MKSMNSSSNPSGKGLPKFGAKKTGAKPLKAVPARKLAKQEKKDSKADPGKGLPKFGGRR